MRHSGSDNGRLCLHGRQAKRQAAGKAAGQAGKAAGGRQQRGRREAGKTGGFCNTFGRQNASKTNAHPMRTRVYPVILCFYTVIPEPKKILPPLRILEKKF